MKPKRRTTSIMFFVSWRFRVTLLKVMAAGSCARIARTAEDLTGIFNVDNEDPVLMVDLELPCFVSAENYAFNVETVREHLKHQGPWNPVTRSPFNAHELDLLRQLGLDTTSSAPKPVELEPTGDAISFLRERFQQRRMDIVEACMFGCDESIYTEGKFIADVEEVCEQILPQVPYEEARRYANGLLRELENGILDGTGDTDRVTMACQAIRAVRHEAAFARSRIDMLREAFAALGMRVVFHADDDDLDDGHEHEEEIETED